MSRSPSSSPAPASTRRHPLPWRVAGTLRGLAVLALLAAVACGEAPTDPRFRQPAVHFDAEALGRLLALASDLEGTPLADAARRALATITPIEGCTTAFGVARPGADALSAADVTCLDSTRAGDDAAHTASAAWAAGRRGDADGWIAWPLGTDGHVEIRLHLDAAGSVSAIGRVAPPTDASVLDLLWPDADAPAASLFDPSRLLVHARARPEGGLGLARFLPDGGQADKLFALKGRLLEGALLSGTWELAFVAASDGGTRPLPVVALHHRGAEPIRAALDEALSQLEETWPITRSARTFELADGARVSGGCYADLPLLPELSPCWAVTGSALVVGYRAAALDAAIGRPPVASAPHSDAYADAVRGTRILADLERLDRLDRRARSDADSAAARITPALLFERIDLSLGRADDHTIAFSARLDRSTP